MRAAPAGLDRSQTKVTDLHCQILMEENIWEGDIIKETTLLGKRGWTSTSVKLDPDINIRSLLSRPEIYFLFDKALMSVCIQQM